MRSTVTDSSAHLAWACFLALTGAGYALCDGPGSAILLWLGAMAHGYVAGVCRGEERERQ